MSFFFPRGIKAKVWLPWNSHPALKAKRIHKAQQFAETSENLVSYLVFTVTILWHFKEKENHTMDVFLDYLMAPFPCFSPRCTAPVLSICCKFLFQGLQWEPFLPQTLHPSGLNEELDTMCWPPFVCWLLSATEKWLALFPWFAIEYTSY